MTGRVSTAAAATLALASASAPRAGWASNASTAGAASGEYGGGVRGAGPARRSRPEAGAGHELGRVGVAPLCLMVACLLGGTLICRLGVLLWWKTEKNGNTLEAFVAVS